MTANNPVPTVGPDEALRWVSEGAVLVDVREQNEWDAGHAPQALHVPLGTLATASLPDYRGRRVLAVCRSGNRSKQAVTLLLARGCDAYSVDAGMNGWQTVGGRVVSASGAPGRIA
jgi:rhodanese-related sulfurtransferase